MIVLLNGDEYGITAEQRKLAVYFALEMLVEEYDKLDGKYRLLAKTLAREILRKMEAEARKKHGNEIALKFRPGKGEDVCIFLLDILSVFVEEALNRVTLSIETDNNTISAFKLSISREGETRRQMVTHGNERVRENNEPEISGCGVHQAIPDHETLHS